ncbi:thermonuclease family protein [Flavobacterium akiainvivens]|uniref:thermonuclease family protein n=1 Tax=Flavobacterium akiainvivens TaxID=1202724 RepID=UPI0008ED89CF|nr:thermonuclease family protein [Flavobacterium akiainvivens]SFQ68401.1 Endonuclease YncB, thermonuclease family [Flavobacterium akiainvivens]
MARSKKGKSGGLGVMGVFILVALVAFYKVYKPGASVRPTEYGQPQPKSRPATEITKKKKEVRALKTFTGKVTAIKDGDTFEVLYDGEPERVRLAEIDCPESAQPYGKKAKQFASDLCFGKTVTVASGSKRDRYGRVVGTVTTEDGVNVNEALVKAGYAWHYKDYSDNAQIGVFEEEARQKGLGLWADSKPTPPWEWRKNKRKKK